MGMFLRRGDPPSTTCMAVFSGQFNSSYCLYRINGTRYTAADVKDLPRGTIIEVYVSGSSAYRAQCYVSLDGKTVQSGNGWYNYELRKDSSLIFNKGSQNYYYCEITTS